MVQKEVMKKTRTYGLIALLLAIVLVAMIYTYGGTQISPVAPQQPGSNQGTQNQGTQTSQQISTQANVQTFASYDELKNFLNQSSSSNLNNAGAYYGVTGINDALPQLAMAPTAAAATSTSTEKAATNDYSTTNIQVAGVDEADTVKTDGQYIYVIGNNSQAVYILSANSQNPQNAKVLSKISFGNGYLSGIYLSTDGSKLAVLGSNYMSYAIYGKFMGLYPANLMFPSWTTSTNFVYIYDISNKVNPVLSRNFTMSGNYVNSRMIGNYVYDIVSENAYLLNGTVLLPTVFTGQQASNVAPTSIHYLSTSDSAYMYTTIVALNIQNALEQTTNTTILMGNAGTIFVSQSNIYLTNQITNYQTTKTPTTTSTIPAQTGITIMPMPPIQLYWQGTAIYRIQISGPTLTFEAHGNVTGTVMSQYSMDEYNSYFRIATTSYDYNSNNYYTTQQNNLYILNSNLSVVGKIENLATGEVLHSARFIADRCYLVTFNQIDPLFVVDLTKPASPMVLGNLTIPGYSDFLQPYDATHLIGIGQDVNASIDADKVHIAGDVYYTAVLGLKVSLFDVGNVANPKEMSKIVIGDTGTTSEALTDPKAILFDASRNLLVLPVELYITSNSTASASPGAIGTAGTGIAVPAPATYYYPQFVWQGVYVFNVDLTNGITIKGNITQLDNASVYLANPALAMTSSYPWTDSQYFITRSLYIGNVLYTVSQSRVQLNSLSNFATLAKINLN